MARPARAVIVLGALVAAVLAGAALVREVVLVADDEVVWHYPHWWSWVTDGPALRAAVAAGLAGAAALLCLAAAARLLRRPAPALRKLEMGEPDAAVVMEASVLDRFLAKAVRRRLLEIESLKVWLYPAGDGYGVRAVASLRACCDLVDLHARTLAALREELQRSTGLAVAGLDLDIEKFDLEGKGVS